MVILNCFCDHFFISSGGDWLSPALNTSIVKQRTNSVMFCPMGYKLFPADAALKLAQV